MEELAYSALWVRLESNGKFVKMACDNENNADPADWQRQFADCIAIRDRFYCGCYALKPYVSGLQLNARVCAVSDIPINKAEDVATLFTLAMGLGAAMQDASNLNWTAAEKEARLFIWDKLESSLWRYADGQIEKLNPGTYTAGFAEVVAEMDIMMTESYSFFEQLRSRLNGTKSWHLDTWPNTRAKFEWQGENHWIHQGFSGNEVIEELAEALTSIIRDRLAI